MTSSAMERLRPLLPAYDHTCGPRLLRRLVAEGEREIVARVLWSYRRRPFAFGPETDPVFAPYYLQADAILEHFAAMALGE